MSERTVTIVKVVHLGASMMGNSYYRLVLDDGTSLRTQINGSVNIGIENSENLNRPVVVTTTKAGRVYDIQPYTGAEIKYERGNIVKTFMGSGVVVRVDHKNAAEGGIMNYQVAVIEDGKIKNKLWYSNAELALIDNGTAEIS